jgi:hypothetical protein
MRSLGLLFFLTLTNYGFSQLSGSYTIGGTAPSYLTFAAAVADLAAQGVSGPTTFNVRNGSYQESVLVDNIPGISAANPVTIQSESGDSSAVVLWHNASSPVDYVLRIENLHDITIRGITVKDEGVIAGQVLWVSNGYNFSFENNRIIGYTGGGSSNSVYVLSVVGADSNITVTNNYIYGGTSITLGVSTSGFGQLVEHVVAEHNQIVGITRFYQVDYPEVRYNQFAGGSKTLWIESCDGFDIGYNRIESTIYGGTRVCDFWFNGSVNVPMRFYNNSMHIVGYYQAGGVNGVISLKGGGQELAHNTIRYDSDHSSHAILILENSDSVKLLNNNFVKLTDGMCIDFFGGTSSAIAQSDHNNFYSDWQVADGGIVTLAQWQTAQNLDFNSLSVDPLFQGLDADSLMPNEPALASAGTPINNVPDDVFGIPRNLASPTIGAFEVLTIPIVNLGADSSYCDSVLLDAGNVGSSFIWSTGATSQSIWAVASGSYSVTATTPEGTDQDTIVITINASPSAPLTDSVSICAGSTETLDAQNAGGTYAWNTGEVSQSIVVDTAGTFTVVITNNGCATTDSTTLNLIPPIVIDLGADTSICEGTLIAFDAGVSSWPTLWSTGDTIQTILADSTANYWVSITDNCGVWSDTISLLVNPQPIVTITGNDTICLGDSTVLTATGADTYAWSGGAGQGTSATYSPSISNFVNVSGTIAATGCTQTFGYWIEVLPLPATPIVTQNGAVLSASAATGYQWYDSSGSISGATNPTYSPTINGQYWIEVTDANGCSALSAAFDFLYFSVESFNLNQFITTRPNPSNGRFQLVRTANWDEQADVLVIDALGKTLYSCTWSSGATSLQIELDVVASGVYFIQVLAAGEVGVLRIVVE